MTADLLSSKVKAGPTTSQGFKSPAVTAAIAEIALLGKTTARRINF